MRVPYVGHQTALVPLLELSPWQMSFGERAGIEGFLHQLKPQLSIELGTAEGGSLERIALHSEEVHSIDMVAPQLEVAEQEHVHIHTGDSHVLLPELLARFEEEGRNVDFVLVDGDHSTEGVKADMEDLLSSAAVARTIIVLHDTANEVVRAGLDSVQYDEFPKVSYVDLDFIPGAVYRMPGLEHELWGGLGLVVVDAANSRYREASAIESRYFSGAEMLRLARDTVTGALDDAGEADELRERVAELEAIASRQSAELESLRAAAEATAAPRGGLAGAMKRRRRAR